MSDSRTPFRISCYGTSNVSDSTEIRSYLGGGRRFRRLLDMPVENINYVVTGKCYPLMGGVISTWLFFGAQVPLGVSFARNTLANDSLGNSTSELGFRFEASSKGHLFSESLCPSAAVPGPCCLRLFFVPQSSQERKSHMKRIKRPPHTKSPLRAPAEGSQPAAESAAQEEQPAQ